MMSYPRLTTERLALKRSVAAGDRAYVIGAADGSFLSMGWHINGEMGGLWAPPIKLLDGYWLTLDGRRLPPAAQLAVHPGHVELNYPSVGGLALTRIEFAPDGLPVLLIGLTVRNTGADLETVRLIMTVRSKLMAAYPWSRSTPQNARAFKGKDEGWYDPATGTRPCYGDPGLQGVWKALVHPDWGDDAARGRYGGRSDR